MYAFYADESGFSKSNKFEENRHLWHKKNPFNWLERICFWRVGGIWTLLHQQEVSVKDRYNHCFNSPCKDTAIIVKIKYLKVENTLTYTKISQNNPPILRGDNWRVKRCQIRSNKLPILRGCLEIKWKFRKIKNNHFPIREFKYNFAMRIFSKGTIRRFWEEYPDAKASLEFWYDTIENTDFE